MSASLPTPREAASLPLQSGLHRVRPLGDQVLILLEPATTHAGLIVLPQSAKPTGKRAARVVAAGGTAIAQGIDAGMRVLVGPDPGWEIAGTPNARMLRVGAIEAVLDEGCEVEG